MQTEPMIALPRPGGISISSLPQAKRHKRKFDAVITAEDPGVRPSHKLRFTLKPAPDHLVLAFEDVDAQPWPDANIWLARMDDVVQALEFARRHVEGSILVHCFHGIGRSAGLAMAIWADRLGPGREREALQKVIDVRPQAVPNRWVVGLADELLKRDGALVDALDDWVARTPHAKSRRLAKAKYVVDFIAFYARRDPKVWDDAPDSAVEALTDEQLVRTETDPGQCRTTAPDF